MSVPDNDWHQTAQIGIRAQVEAVRVRANHRNKGIGKAVFEYAMERARSKEGHILQRITNQ
ncbi:GNAT family N-acetyltransferase [Larkinella rosea]|uniref:N-acetyltransferase n=1 Tax=Larkinella rosea TaxID=2025312 RepID=A0A3P1BVV7_9BACT|nr:N-acetyltransferase [Larkinella rosea]